MQIRKRALLLTLFTTLLITSCTPNPSSSSSGNPDTTSIPSIESESGTSTSPFVSAPAQYTITFYTGTSTTIAQIKAIAGASINEPASPFKDGHDFVGWYEDYGLWNEPFTFSQMPERNVVLYAHYIEQSSGEIGEYHRQLAEMSQKDHLYIHYRRFAQSSDEYKKWDIWVWPQNETGRMVDFVKNPDGSTYFDQYGGAMIDIDLNQTYTDGGHDGKGNKTNETVTFTKDSTIVDQIGFLITFKESRSSGSHWTSDGGDKFLSTKEAVKYGPNGSLHVFAVQENVRDFKYVYGGEVYENPYESDDGTNVSLKYKDVDSSGPTSDIAPTSETLKELGVGYQIMVASFADSDGDGMGDIRGIVENFDYFVNLNIEVLWLTPIQLSDSYHGYDTIDYRKVDPKFGSKTSPHTKDGVVTSKSAMLDYIDLMHEADQHDMKIVMDLVVNHTSINNVLFQESLSLNPEYRAYYHWQNHTDTSLNQFWHPYSTYEYSYYGKFASSMPELNYDYQATRDVIVDIMNYWVVLGVAGFRIDAVKHVYMAEEVTPSSGDVIIKDGGSTVNYDSNLTKNLHFFKELNARLKQEHPDAFIVGENYDGHAYRVAPYYEGLDSMLNFYMYYNIMESAANGDRLPTYRKAAGVTGAYVPEGGNDFVPNVQQDPANPDTKVNVTYGGAWNYLGVSQTFDKYRSNNGAINTKAVDGLFTSNHDLVRPVNKITGALNDSGSLTTRGTISASNGAKATQMSLTTIAATLLLPGLSWIYYGDELGMSSNLGSGDTETSPHADRWARQPFKWDTSGSSKYTTGYSFSGNKTFSVEWDSYNATLKGVLEQSSDASSLLNSVRSLTELKKQERTLKVGSYTPLDLSKYASDYNVFAFTRSFEGENIHVLINMSNTSVALSQLSGDIMLSLGNATKTNLPAWSVLVTKV